MHRAVFDRSVCSFAAKIFTCTAEPHQWAELPGLRKKYARAVPGKLQSEKMMSTAARTSIPSIAVPVVYTLICILAVGFDLSTDRSFGALMLAVLPISLVALACLLVGPWLEGKRKFTAIRDWLIGALLVLFISIAFASLGAEQAKTGELIFTYAALIISLPASLALPFVAMMVEPFFAGNVFMRIITGWAVCVVSGWLEWQVLSWLYKTVRQRIKN